KDSSGEGLVLTPVPLLIDEECQAVEEAQLPRGFILFLMFQRLDHPLKLESIEFSFIGCCNMIVSPFYSKYSAPRMLSCDGGRDSGGGSGSGCWSSEFFKIDFTLWYRQAPVRMARSAAASILVEEYSSARRMIPRQDRYPISGCGFSARICSNNFAVCGPIC